MSFSVNSVLFGLYTFFQISKYNICQVIISQGKSNTYDRQKVKMAKKIRPKSVVADPYSNAVIVEYLVESLSGVDNKVSIESGSRSSLYIIIFLSSDNN